MDGRKNRAGKVALLVAASAAALLLAACGGGSSGAQANLPASDAAAQSQAPVQTANGTPVAVAVGDTDPSHMYMNLDSSKVQSGPVTFTIKNEGVKVHEFVVLDTATAAKGLEMAGDEVNEDAYAGVGEAEDIQPGDTAHLTLDLKRGHYALICNLKGHFRMGMFNDLQVT